MTANGASNGTPGYSLRKALAKGTAMDRRFGAPRSAQYTKDAKYEGPTQSVTLTHAEMRNCMLAHDGPEQWQAMQMILAIKGVPADVLVGSGKVKAIREEADGTVTVEY